MSDLQQLVKLVRLVGLCVVWDLLGLLLSGRLYRNVTVQALLLAFLGRVEPRAHVLGVFIHFCNMYLLSHQQIMTRSDFLLLCDAHLLAPINNQSGVDFVLLGLLCCNLQVYHVLRWSWVV